MATMPCRSCGKPLEVPDDGLGRWIRCDRCDARTELPETSVRYANPRSKVTFSQFISLLTTADRDELNDKVLLPVGLRLESDGGLVSIGIAREYNRPVAAEEAHRIVQFDQVAQRELILIAIPIWR